MAQQSAEGLALIYGRAWCGTSQAVAEGERRPHIEMMSGSCKRDAVWDSSAVPPRARLESRSWAKPGCNFYYWLLWGGCCGSALTRLCLDISFSWLYFYMKPIISNRNRKPISRQFGSPDRLPQIPEDHFLTKVRWWMTYRERRFVEWTPLSRQWVKRHQSFDVL